MDFKILYLFIFLCGNAFGTPDLTQFVPNFQEEWLKYLKDPNRVVGVSENCNKQVDGMTSALMQMQDWAMQMFDASSKLQSGIFQGNLIDFGEYDQCLKVRHISQDLGLVKGQHCMVTTRVDLVQFIIFIMTSLGSSGIQNAGLNPDQIIKELTEERINHENLQNMARSIDGLKQLETRDDDQAVILEMSFGTCLPASCTPLEVVKVVDDFLRTYLNLTATPNVNQEFLCNTNDGIELRPVDIACIVFFSFIGLLMILSTSYDLLKQFICKDGSPPKDIYLAFSVWSNGKKVFALNPVDNKSNGDTLHCVHGLRAISIIWVMFCHRYTMAIMFALTNMIIIPDWFAEYYSPIVSGGTVSVDTFFVLSGLLLGYIFLKTVTKTNRFNVPMFYIHRYFRLTPPLGVMILFQASLLVYFGSGPFWRMYMDKVVGESCRKNGWLGFLYVQNYINRDEICHGPSWYLACDMQLFILSPILLYPLWKWAKAGVALGVALIFACLATVFSITYINDYGGAPIPIAGTTDMFNRLYVPVHTRFGPWVLGMLLGYLLHTYRNTEIKLNKLMVCCGWVSATLLFFTILFGVYPFVQMDGKPEDLLAGAFFQTFSRISWSLSICWIIFACTKGYGGPVNWFLSLPFWQPISRLSFCLYLTHYPIQMALQFSTKHPETFSDFNMVYKFWGDFGISLCVSAVWCLAFESPITVLEKVLFQRNEKPKTELPEKNKEIDQLVSPNNLASLENGTGEKRLLESGNVNDAYVEDGKR